MWASGVAGVGVTSVGRPRPVLVTDLLEPLLDVVGMEHVGGVLVLAGVLLYGHHLLSAGRLVGSWVRSGLVAVGALIALRLLGVIPSLRLDRLAEVAAWASDAVLGVVT
jgi:hypothetical protein